MSSVFMMVSSVTQPEPEASKAQSEIEDCSQPITAGVVTDTQKNRRGLSGKSRFTQFITVYLGSHGFRPQKMSGLVGSFTTN